MILLTNWKSRPQLAADSWSRLNSSWRCYLSSSSPVVVIKALHVGGDDNDVVLAGVELLDDQTAALDRPLAVEQAGGQQSQLPQAHTCAGGSRSRASWRRWSSCHRSSAACTRKGRTGAEPCQTLPAGWRNATVERGGKGCSFSLNKTVLCRILSSSLNKILLILDRSCDMVALATNNW